MMSLPHALYAPAQVGRLDRYAIDDLGVPGTELMDRAGGFAYETLRAAWPDCRRLVVLCGVGNNSGDGYVIAHLARQDGLAVRVVQLGDPDRLAGDAAAAANRYLSAGGEREAGAGALAIAADAVVVDALFGTGLQRPVEGCWAAAVNAANAAGRPVLAVDIPSGLSGDTGAVLGTAIRADITTTFIGLKRGLFTGAGPARAGTILYDSLGLPGELMTRETPCAWRTDYPSLRHLLGPRARDGHKGDYGHVLVVGGNDGTGGAVVMSTLGALRCGAGLVSVATRPANAAVVLGHCPESMVRGVESAPELGQLIARADVIAIGPGLGQDAWASALLETAVGSGLPLVVDADALNLLANRPGPLPQAILTPHPGEAARLLGQTTAEVQSDRWGAAARLVARYDATVILKGAGSIIASSGHSPRVCSNGNPGMATGGAGDVLTGVCAGLLAQGFAPPTAAELAVCVHAAAGDVAAEQGERGMVATDLIPPVRGLMNPS